MSDWVAGHIYIGGEVTSAQLQDMLKVIRGEGCNFEWNGDSETTFTKASDILENLDDKGHLHLGSADAPSGMFEGLEKFLRDNQIPYTRYSDGLPGSWDAAVNFYRKGYKEDIDLVTSNNGDPVILASVAIEAYAALKAGNVHAALEVLAPFQKSAVPELPPFQLVDGVP
jgi:hypothetical protein